MNNYSKYVSFTENDSLLYRLKKLLFDLYNRNITNTYVQMSPFIKKNIYKDLDNIKMLPRTSFKYYMELQNIKLFSLPKYANLSHTIIFIPTPMQSSTIIYSCQSIEQHFSYK